MGCSSSKSSSRSNNMNQHFKVCILSSRGHESATARIEITRNELILHQQNGQATRWPLSGLRHYGYADELFSFESGRRCPGGEGVYAFKCHSAESLFNQLQENIQLAAESQNIANRFAAGNHAALLARFRASSGHNAAFSSGTAAATHVDNASNAVHEYINTLHDYVNTLQNISKQTSPHDHVPINYADLDLPTTSDNGCDLINLDMAENICRYSPRSMYVNLPCGDKEFDVLSDNACRGHMDCNNGQASNLKTTFCAKSPMSRRAPLRCQSYNAPQSPRSRQWMSPRLSALRDNSTPPTTRSANASVGSYTAIDFEKTNALSDRKLSASAASDDGIRRTRHSAARENMDLL